MILPFASVLWLSAFATVVCHTESECEAVEEVKAVHGSALLQTRKSPSTALGTASTCMHRKIQDAYLKDMRTGRSLMRNQCEEPVAHPEAQRVSWLQSMTFHKRQTPSTSCENDDAQLQAKFGLADTCSNILDGIPCNEGQPGGRQMMCVIVAPDGVTHMKDVCCQSCEPCVPTTTPTTTVATTTTAEATTTVAATTTVVATTTTAEATTTAAATTTVAATTTAAAPTTAVATTAASTSCENDDEQYKTLFGVTDGCAASLESVGCQPGVAGGRQFLCILVTDTGIHVRDVCCQSCAPCFTTTTTTTAVTTTTVSTTLASTTTTKKATTTTLPPTTTTKKATTTTLPPTTTTKKASTTTLPPTTTTKKASTTTLPPTTTTKKASTTTLPPTTTTKKASTTTLPPTTTTKEATTTTLPPTTTTQMATTTLPSPTTTTKKTTPTLAPTEAPTPAPTVVPEVEPDFTCDSRNGLTDAKAALNSYCHELRKDVSGGCAAYYAQNPGNGNINFCLEPNDGGDMCWRFKAEFICPLPEPPAPAPEPAPEPVLEASPEPVLEAAPEPVSESAPEVVQELAFEPVSEAAPEAEPPCLHGNGNGDPMDPFTGADPFCATLDAEGFLAITSRCCPWKVETWFNRLLTSKGYKVCSKPHIQGLMHWFTCVPNMDFNYILEHIEQGTYAGCKYWAKEEDECPTVEGTVCDNPCQP